MLRCSALQRTRYTSLAADRHIGRLDDAHAAFCMTWGWEPSNGKQLVDKDACDACRNNRPNTILYAATLHSGA